MKNISKRDFRPLSIIAIVILAFIFMGSMSSQNETDYERQERLIHEYEDKLMPEKGKTIAGFTVTGKADGTIDIWIQAYNKYHGGLIIQETKISKMGKHMNTTTWVGNSYRSTPLISLE